MQKKGLGGVEVMHHGGNMGVGNASLGQRLGDRRRQVGVGAGCREKEYDGNQAFL